MVYVTDIYHFSAHGLCHCEDFDRGEWYLHRLRCCADHCFVQSHWAAVCSHNPSFFIVAAEPQWVDLLQYPLVN